jgi:hypothetical protein
VLQLWIVGPRQQNDFQRSIVVELFAPVCSLGYEFKWMLDEYINGERTKASPVLP